MDSLIGNSLNKQHFVCLHEYEIKGAIVKGRGHFVMYVPFLTNDVNDMFEGKIVSIGNRYRVVIDRFAGK